MNRCTGHVAIPANVSCFHYNKQFPNDHRTLLVSVYLTKYGLLDLHIFICLLHYNKQLGFTKIYIFQQWTKESGQSIEKSSMSFHLNIRDKLDFFPTKAGGNFQHSAALLLQFEWKWN